MRKILIIGCSGAGKSTLSRKLGEKLAIPVIHLDQLWWREGWNHISREEFDEALEREMEKETWIMDGNFNRTLPVRVQHCDTVIFLDFPRYLCFLGIFQRILTTYGKVRPDMSPGCPERIDWDFLKFVWNFKNADRVENYERLEKDPPEKLIVLKNRREVHDFLASLDPACN